MTVNQITRRNPDGSVFGYDGDDLVAFYGATPVVQPASSSQAIVSTTTISTTPATTAATSTTPYGFADSTQADAIVTAVRALVTQSNANMALANQLRADLITLGLIKGSA